jgi:uncharacterized OB-fold protein
MPPTDEDLVTAFDGLVIDQDNRSYYAGWLEERLLINKCDQCQRFHHPPLPACPTCWSFDLTPTEVSGRGKVFCYIGLYQGPMVAGVDYKDGYPIAAVELEEQSGLRLASGIKDVSVADVEVGMRLEICWMKRFGSPFPLFVAQARSDTADV